MRIALVNNFFSPRASGSAHMTEQLAAGLVALGHEVLVVTASFEDAPADEIRDGYRVVRLKSWSVPKSKLTFRFNINFAIGPRNFRKLFRLLDDFAPNVIHQHGQFFDLTFMSSCYARRRGIPTVLSVHTRLEHTSPPHNFVLWLGDVTLVRFFINLSRPHVVIMDELMHGYVSRRYRIPEDRMEDIPVGVEPLRFNVLDDHELRTTLGIGTRPVVMSLGHVIPLRDRLALVEALPFLIEVRPDVVVVVVGSLYDERFIDRAEALGVRDHMILTGGVPKDDVPRYLSLADVETHDLQGYGLGTASLEVMAAGIPVVSVIGIDNFRGIELRSWEHLVIVPPDDPRSLAGALDRLLGDKTLADQVGAGGRELIMEQFTFDAVIKQHVALFEKIAATPIH